MKKSMLKIVALIVSLMFVCSLSTIVSAATVGNMDMDLGNVGIKLGKPGKDVNNVSMDLENFVKYQETLTSNENPSADVPGAHAPIPSSVLLLASGLGGLAILRKKFKRT